MVQLRSEMDEAHEAALLHHHDHAREVLALPTLYCTQNKMVQSIDA